MKNKNLEKDRHEAVNAPLFVGEFTTDNVNECCSCKLSIDVPKVHFSEDPLIILSLTQDIHARLVELRTIETSDYRYANVQILFSEIITDDYGIY